MIRMASDKAEFEATKGEREAALNQVRKRVILEGAWRVFARDGLEGATMRSIAAASGCTTGALYPLFPSKEAIYAELLAESLSRLRSSVNSAIEGVLDPRARLTAGARAFLSYYRDRANEVALGLYLWQGLRPKGLSPELNAELNSRLDDTLDLLRGALRELGSLDDKTARLETAALFAFLIGALIVHQTGRLRTLGSDLEAIASSHIEGIVGRLQS